MATRPTRRTSRRAQRSTPRAKRLTGRDYFKALGPGLVTGASDDDPSGIATYAQAGASHGLGLLWTSLLTFPLMAAVQEICDRTALATGTTLGQLAAERFQRVGRLVVTGMIAVLIVANTLNVAADLVAVGSGMRLLHLGPTWLWALVAGVAITLVVTFGSFTRIALIFKILCLALFSYIIVAIVVTHDWLTVLRDTVVPDVQLNRTYLALLVAILGTTISPYLFFWQNAERLEDMRSEPEGGDEPLVLASRGTAEAALKEKMSRFDVFSGMGFSNIVMFSIIITTSATLHAHHVATIQSAAQAATSLKPFAGRFASSIFALGFIGSGFIAIPVLAASGSVGLAGILGKEWGFSKSLRKAPFFYALVAVGTVGGTVLSLVHVNPIKLLVFSAVVNGVTAAPLLFVVMRISGSRELMGTYVNGRVARILGWATFALMAAAALTLIASGGISF